MIQGKKAKIARVRYEVLVSWTQWFLLFLALAFYIYFIATSVFQVVLRQELMVSIQEAETRVSQLEATYFEKTNAISMDTAAEYGLVAISAPTYVTVNAKGDKLTRND